MPLRQGLSLFLVALLVVGCMNVSSTLTVRPDGSGTITERFTLNADLARMLQDLDRGADSTGTPQDLFSEAALRAEADSLPGLRLQSFTRIDDVTSTGYEAVYAFDDLNAVRFDPGPDDVLPEGALEETDESPLDLMSEMQFDFTPGTPATLTVHMPLDAAETDGDEPTADPATTDDTPPSDEELEMVRAMMKDAGFRVAVTIDGQIVETNATHRSGSTITLVEMDFETLARDSTAFREMMQLSEKATGSAETIDRLNALPGVALEPQETVTVRFR